MEPSDGWILVVAAPVLAVAQMGVARVRSRRNCQPASRRVLAVSRLLGHYCTVALLALGSAILFWSFFPGILAALFVGLALVPLLVSMILGLYMICMVFSETRQSMLRK